MAAQAPVPATTDAVPFRLTPAIQHFLGPIATEGILTSAIMALGRCLTEPEVSHLFPRFILYNIDSWAVRAGTKPLSRGA